MKAKIWFTTKTEYAATVDLDEDEIDIMQSDDRWEERMMLLDSLSVMKFKENEEIEVDEWDLEDSTNE